MNEGCLTLLSKRTNLDDRMARLFHGLYRFIQNTLAYPRPVQVIRFIRLQFTSTPASSRGAAA